MQAVFRSWNTPRAIAYRDAEHIPHDLGTAANVQAMVFGNIGCRARHRGRVHAQSQSTGEPGMFGEYLPNAQGEDVVAGVRTPLPISKMAEDPTSSSRRMRICSRSARLLERHYRDMQDLEFTVERGELWMLQTRTGKRTADAAVRIAVDMAERD